MLTIPELHKKVANGRARLDIATTSLERKQADLGKHGADLDSLRKALALLQDVASKTQDQLTDAIEHIVQGSIDLLFPGYKFKVNFVPKRGKVDAEFRLCKGEVEFDPLESNGGGVVDAITFSLRAGCLRLANKRQLLLLDEPFKYVRDGENVKPRKELGRVLATLVEKLGVQVLMVGDVAGTDINADTEYAF